MRPPECDVCGERQGCTTLRFADFEPLPAGMVGHPRGLHWLCEEHRAALDGSTHLRWHAALAGFRAAQAPPVSTGTIDLQWPDGDGTSGVHDHEGPLLWWTRPGGPGGRFGEAARGQGKDDYREHGPAVDCPAHVEAELDARLGRRRG